MGGFSKQSLSEQLDYEGFSSEQINYALKEVGY
ncbi:MAG: Ltp family lipoprotein [Clostridia bacterium]|nr:Ltp family lipoprotein [Clostridia bacterium]